MMSHALARKLLEGPDLPVQVSIADPKDTAYTKDITVELSTADPDIIRVEGWVWSDDEDAFAPWG